VTTWGPGLWEPASSVFWHCVGEVEPALYKAFNPWDEITTPEALERLFASAGIADATTEALAGEQRLEQPEDAWDIVEGSGLRGTLDDVREAQREVLRERVLVRLRSQDVRAVRTDVVLGRAIRPAVAAV
jgi:hypothetical protein